MSTIRLADQAEGLRLVRGEGRPSVPLLRGNGAHTRTIAVTSGKGGVGKTQMTANIAVGLARRGLSVCVFDADLGLASLDLALGVIPQDDLLSVVRGERSVEEIMVEGPYGVHLVPACPGRYEMANMNAAQRNRLTEALTDAASRFDVLIIDTGAGIGSNAVSFASYADEILLVVTPDPTSLRDAYAMAKVLHRRAGVDRVQMVANQVSSEMEGAELFDRVDGIVSRFLSLEFTYLGAVPRDEAVREGVVCGEPCVMSAPGSPAARALSILARRLDPEKSPREMC